MPPTPSAEVIQRIQAGAVEIYARADIYEADTTTPWMLDAPLLDGSVSVDFARDERRQCSLVFANPTGALKSRPGGFWYDKVIKVFRGIRGHINYLQDDGTLPIYDDDLETIEDETILLEDWETQIGEFYIDDIDMTRFPGAVSVSGRDGTKKLLQAKFATSTEFASGVSIESIVQAVAFAGGIPIAKMNLPLTGVNTDRKHLYDRTTERWAAIKEVCEVNGYQVYFDYEGLLTLEPFADPADPGESPSVWTFEIGGRNVRNGDFEDLNPVNGEPEWWYEVTTGSPTFAVTNDGQARSGDYAARITTPTGADGGGVYSGRLKVEPGWVFRISAWSKATVNTGGGKYIRAMFRTSEAAAWSAEAMVVNNANFTHEYTEDSGLITVPAGISHMDIRLDNWTGTAKTVWWDDVLVERVFPAEDVKGNLVNYQKKSLSARIYNHVVVTGESSDRPPVWEQVENNEPTSPTRIAELGRRTYFYTSAFITTEAQALATAQRFLAIHALEAFEVGLESIVLPWLEPGQVVEFIDPEAAASDPVRYLLSDITIPLRPAPMAANVKRVTVVG